MSKLENAMRALRTYFQTLSNDMQACIDTGNNAEADLVLASAREHLREDKITVVQMAEIQADYNTKF